MKLKRHSKPNQQTAGFSLLEVMLVMVIISAFMIMGIGYMQQRTLNLKLDKTAAQMQQILNAGISYYVNNSAWPANFNCLKGIGGGCTQAYLPSTLTNNPFGGAYTIASTSTSFYVSTIIASTSAPAYTQVIAGKLPVGESTDNVTGGVTSGTKPCPAATTTCYVLSSVPIPGQNAASATAVNFAGLYHNGACVPVPNCPSGSSMVPQIMVVPAAVSGVFEAPSPACSESNLPACNVRSYPITSYTARATAAAAATAGSGPLECNSPVVGTPPAAKPCIQQSTPTTYITTSEQYWRVCLDVITEAGAVTPSVNTQGLLAGTVMAITRCAVPAEKVGSGFTVWAK